MSRFRRRTPAKEMNFRWPVFPVPTFFADLNASRSCRRGLEPLQAIAVAARAGEGAVLFDFDGYFRFD